MMTPRMAMMTTVIRAASMLFFSEMFRCSVSRSRFSDTLEDAASSWESAVDMVLARMPERTRPAISAGRMPCLERRSATLTMMVSVLLPESCATHRCC